jgi:L-arabinonolactonase
MRTLIAEPDLLGDGPIWDGRSQRLTWLDIVGKRISSCNADGSQLERHSLAETPGSHAPRVRGGRLIAFRRRVVVFDAAGSEQCCITPACADLARERFNDGACDNRGRFWVGTMDRYLREPVGALYRIEPDHAAVRVATGIGISNGLAWSPDFDRLYQCDSLFPRIYVYQYDAAAGLATNRRVFAEFGPGMGAPDGCAIDTAGGLWVAAPGSGRVLRFDPDGRLTDFLETPTQWPSSVTFGGRDMRTLFITSLQPRESSTAPGALATHGAAEKPAVESQRVGSFDGGVFAADAPVSGVVRHDFGG